MFKDLATEFVADAKEAGFKIVLRGDFADQLGRPEVGWKAYVMVMQFVRRAIRFSLCFQIYSGNATYGMETLFVRRKFYCEAA